MATARAPNQWSLTKSETISTFETWRSNIQYTLSLDNNFDPYLIDGVIWRKKSKDDPFRGFSADGDAIDARYRKTALQKVKCLELMLGQIANYCPVIARNSIVKNSTSLEFVWQTIRTHYGFQTTGGHFLDFADISFQPDERPEDLFQRLEAFVDDSLLRTDGKISHHGVIPDEDEERSPTLDNFVVLTWLRLLHPNLPKLVKQRYGTELRSRSLASIKEEISQALDSLLDELSYNEEVKTLRSKPTKDVSKRRQSHQRPQRDKHNHTYTSKSCPLCKQAGRSEFKHYLSTCPYLPDSDKTFITKSRSVVTNEEIPNEEDHSNARCVQDSDSDSEYDEYTDNQDEFHGDHSHARAVQVRKSPIFNTFFKHHTVKLTIDSGAEANMMKASEASRLGLKVTRTNHRALQADGKSHMNVIGETRLVLTRDDKKLHMEALVVKDLDVDVLAGMPFMISNDISIRPATQTLRVGKKGSYPYTYHNQDHGPHVIRRTNTYVLKAPSRKTTVWPGEYLELNVPKEIEPDSVLALEPRCDSSVFTQWPEPRVISLVGNTIRIYNNTHQFVNLRRNEHFGQVLEVSNRMAKTHTCTPTPVSRRNDATGLHSQAVAVDPDNILPPDIKSEIIQALTDYDNVFDPAFPGYNGSCGKFENIVNMGPVQPPQRKGHVPQYSQDKLVELQEKFDELEKLGVFRKPEEVGVVAEYLNPSFLIKKPNGGHRLVTAFADVGRYSKPQPSIMPDVDSTLRKIGQWRYIATTDLTKSFYQIPLAKVSSKYCGVATPFKGVRVYTRTAMGMPGSETALEELMSRVLGDLLQEGVVAKLADDLFCGGNTPQELLNNWIRVLQAFEACDLKLSSTKTVIAPKQTTILGWIWCEGKIQASGHTVAALSTCNRPTTVRGLRSFIGAYKVLARVVPQCAQFMSPLDNIVAGSTSQDTIVWSEEQIAAFVQAQEHISSNKAIVLPKRSDELWIVTDGSVKQRGIGATMYAVRNGTPALAGFYSTKLRKRQVTWLPCEIEALNITAAVKHFSPFIIQSNHQTCVLTDNKPCVQALEKLCRGEFSASPRVATFLTAVSRYNVSIRHITGANNLISDFASRHPTECNSRDCQICLFVAESEDCVVRQTTTQDIIDGNVRLPFTSRAAWLQTQSDCPDIRRTRAHLKQGTRPAKKSTNIRDVKRYLNVASLAKDGLLIVKRQELLSRDRECIVVPRGVLSGLVTALHLKLDHPSAYQLKSVVRRQFYALDMDKMVDTVTQSCHVCASLKPVPHVLQDQTSTDPPETIGMSFAADAFKRNKQIVLLLRETVTSYTEACLIEDERAATLRDALITMCVKLSPLDGPPAVIRTDPAPGFQALANDKALSKVNITIELGRVKNVNKNPVAERAIQELENEICRQENRLDVLTPVKLAVTVARLNSRVRSSGLSAREMLFQRDQYTNIQLPINDRDLILAQNERRTENHTYSAASKAGFGKRPHECDINIGDIVYVVADRDKHRGRNRYLVTSYDGEWLMIRKFVGSQLRATSYRVKRCECYRVPVDQTLTLTPIPRMERNEDDQQPYELPPLRTIPHDIAPTDQADRVDEIPPQPPDTEQATHDADSTGRPIRPKRPPDYLKDYVTS